MKSPQTGQKTRSLPLAHVSLTRPAVDGIGLDLNGSRTERPRPSRISSPPRNKGRRSAKRCKVRDSGIVRDNKLRRSTESPEIGDRTSSRPVAKPKGTILAKSFGDRCLFRAAHDEPLPPGLLNDQPSQPFEAILSPAPGFRHRTRRENPERLIRRNQRLGIGPGRLDRKRPHLSRNGWIQFVLSRNRPERVDIRSRGDEALALWEKQFKISLRTVENPSPIRLVTLGQ